MDIDLEKYIQSCIVGGEARERGDIKLGNKHAKIVHSITLP